MATHVSHAGLPFPVKGARYTVLVPFFNTSGDPTDPTTPDTEVSKDGGDFADAAEEVTVIGGTSDGMGYLTLSGAEMDVSALAVQCKAASGPKPTMLALAPRVLPSVHSGTAQAGAAGSITLASGASAIDDYYNGMIVKTTGGTGGGGTGGANNQARVITDYNGSTKVATVVPDWETNPANDTTYQVLMTEFAVWGHLLLDVLATTARGEPGQGEPPASAIPLLKGDYLYKALINKMTEDRATGQRSLYNNAGSTVDQKATDTDAGGVFTRGKLGSGP